MKLCNETITVFNKRMDEDTGYDRYYPTVITGASWFCEISSNVDETGLLAANMFTIRIPIDADFSGKSYVLPVDYPDSDPTNTFTLGNGDIIVKGAVTTPGLKPSDLQEMFGEIVTILGVTDNRRARAKHWKVVGR
ncbi:MAG: hypothetical protein IKP31_07645 [Lachnospiraceae bacterium]|nr:hypothetical protein [Lachnospiraceae bacterium]